MARIFALLFLLAHLAHSNSANQVIKIITCVGALTAADEAYQKVRSRGTDHWVHDGFQTNEYSEVFQDVLETRTFEQLFKKLKKENKSTNIFDPFGSGLYPAEIKHLDSVTGLRMGLPDVDHRSGPALSHENYDVLYGDIFNAETWRELDENLAEREVSHFDVTTINPRAGLNYFIALSKTEEGRIAVSTAIKTVIQNCWSRSNPNGGKIYIRIGSVLSIPEITEWINVLEHSGFVTARGEVNFVLTRDPTSPAELPQ